MKRSSLALALLSIATPARAGTPFGDAIQVEILAESVKHTVSLGDSLSALRDGVHAAQENLSLLRSVYGGIDDFHHFDPKQFLDEAKWYFMAQNSAIGETTWFAQDFARNGIRGSFDPYPINRRVSDAKLIERCRAELAAHRAERSSTPLSGDCARFGYDTRQAMSVSADFNSVLADPTRRRNLAQAPAIPSALEGSIDYDLAKADPNLMAALMMQRAQAREAAVQAMSLYMESLGASPGKAEELAAQAASLSAAQLGSLNEKQARILALMELERGEKAAASAQDKARQDALTTQMEGSIDRAFAPRKALAVPSLSDK